MLIRTKNISGHLRFFVGKTAEGYILKLSASDGQTTEVFQSLMATLIPQVGELFRIRRASLDERIRYTAKEAEKFGKRKSLMLPGTMASLIEKHSISGKLARRAVGCMIRSEEQQHIEAGVATASEIRENTR